jgi:hypothetical protein
MNKFDIGQSLEDMVTKLFSFLPQIIGALIVLLVGYIIAKVLASIVRKALQKLRFDRAMHRSAAGDTISRIVESPSRFMSRIVFWLVYIGAISMAISVLNLPLLNDLLSSVYGYVPHIIASIVIFLVASAVSAGTAKFVQRVMGKTATASLITTVVPVLVLSVAAFMILNELQIATDIVNILFTAIVGALSLGLALAFGLGGRDVARQILDQAYESGKSNVSVAKADVQRAARNTKQEANNIKDRM